MSRRILLSVAFLLVIFANSIFAGGIEIGEIGTKASSMGGAFHGLADDGTAIFWNPAGLTQISGQSVSAEASFAQIRSKVGQSYYNSGVISGYKTEDIEQKKEWQLIPTVTYTNDINITRNKLKFGLGVYTQHGLGTEFDLFSDPVNYPAYPEYDWKSAGNFTSIHPALAKQINDRVSVGVGLFATRGDLEQRGPTILPGAASSFDSLLTGDVVIDSILKGDGWGYGGNIGVLCKVNKEFTWGLSYRSATSVRLSGDTEVNAYAPTAGIILTERSASSTKMALPANLGFGMVYRPEEKLIISTDVNWTEWSSYDRFVITNDTPGALITPTATAVNDWKNTIKYSMGLTYKIDNNFNIYTGYYIDPSPIPDKTLTPWIPDCGTKQAFELAFKYSTKTVGFTCGYEHMMSASRIVTGSPQDVDGDGTVDNLPGNYILKSGIIRLGANILF